MPLIEALGFSRHHRRDAVDIDFQLPQTNQVFPDLGFSDDKIETMSVDKLIAGTIQSQTITLGVLNGAGDVYIAGGTVNATAWTANNGFILGLDDSDNNREKFYIGNGVSWLDWNVTAPDTLTITGTLVAVAGFIGGFEIGADYIRDVANSFGLASTVTGGDDVRFWAGSTFANRATAPARITEAGNATFNSVTLSGTVNVLALTSGSILTIQDWTYSGAFSSTDADTVAWAAGTLTMGNGQTFAIGGGNTGNMVAKTYIFFDSAVSTIAFQTTTTRANAFGLNRILVAVAQNETNEASFIKFGDDEFNIDGAQIMARSVTATEIVVDTITANEIAANTITGTEILTMNIAGKNATFDTGTVGGWTLAATTLSSTNISLVTGVANVAHIEVGTGADLAGMNAGAVGGDIAFWAGDTFANRAVAEFRVTLAGALTATSATITGSITATSGAIGGFDIGSDYIRDVANSFGLASTVTGGDDVRFWAGDTFANRATAPARITESGAATFTSITLSGTVNVLALTSGSILTIQNWTYSGAFTASDADTVAWAAGTLTMGNGQTFAIGGDNTGNMVAKTYIFFDSAVSLVAFQTTTTRANAFGLNRILIAVAQNETNEASFIKFGDDEFNLDGAQIMARSVTANEIVADTITANEIAANTITGTEILTMNIAGKNATFDTGTIGGFTMGATTLTATNLQMVSGAANTARFEVGTGANLAGMNSANAGGDITFWSGDTFANRATAPFRVTAAGALTAASGTVGGWTLSATDLTSTNIALVTGAANTARITVGTGANLAGMNSANAGGDITFWAGDTFANRATAPFRVTAAGAVTMSNITITGGSISGITDLAIADGGSGASTALVAFNNLSPITTRGDLITRDATNNIRLAIGAANRVLRSDGTDPLWGQVVLTTDVTGTLPIGNGGTGQVTATAAFNALDPLTTKGDVIVHDGTNSVRQAVGGDGAVLTADSAQTNGIAWSTAAWLDLLRLAQSGRSTKFFGNANDSMNQTTGGAASSIDRTTGTVGSETTLIAGTSIPSRAILKSSPGGGGAGSIFQNLDWDNDTYFFCEGYFTSLTDQNAILGFGFVTDTDSPDIPNDATSTRRHICFYIDDAILYASNADGVTQTRTDVSAGITLTNWNSYVINYDADTNIRFYINGTLVATHTTNRPTGGTDWQLLFGIESTAGASRQLNISNTYIVLMASP